MLLPFHTVHPDHLPKRPLVISYPLLGSAERNLERNPGILIASADDLLNAPRVTDAILVEMFNTLTTGPQLKKFADRATAVSHVWDLLTGAASSVRFMPQSEPAADSREAQTRAGAVRAATDQYLYATDPFVRSEGMRKLKELKAPIPELAPAAEKESDMPKSKMTAATTTKAPKISKAASGQKPKSVSELGTVREGSDRAKILALMDGSRTPAEISKAMGFPAKFGGDEKKATNYVNQHAYCAWRDTGVGYAFEDGKLLATYPGKKTLADVIKAPAAAAPKAPAAKAKAKAKPAAKAKAPKKAKNGAAEPAPAANEESDPASAGGESVAEGATA